MKFFRSLIVATALIATSFAAASYAPPAVDVSGLTESQIADLKIQALKLQQSQQNKQSNPLEQATNISTAARTEAEKWADFGKNIGVAMVSTSRELGIAVNEFSKTDIGRITTAIIVYKLVGSQILHFITGLLLLVMLPSLIIAGRNYIMRGDVEYAFEDRKFLFFLPYRKKVIKSIRQKIEGDDAIWVFLWTCVLTLASILFSLWIMLG